MTVSDGDRLRRGSLTDQERAERAVRAWRLADKFNMSYRAISEKWEKEEGFYVSHVTLRKWVNDARNQSKILELYEPAQVRLDLLGKYERYQESIQAAMDGGEIEFADGMKMLIQVGRDIAKLTNAPVSPTSRVEVTTTERVTPNLALMEEIRKLEAYEREKEEMEANDGLMD